MRVVAEVDVELGLTRVVWIGTAQDVGRAINPQRCSARSRAARAGLGLALMEELQTREGRIVNASFTDYLIPTFLTCRRWTSSSSRTPSRTRPTASRASASRRPSSRPRRRAALRAATAASCPRPVSRLPTPAGAEDG
jgi:hypothetical protein